MTLLRIIFIRNKKKKKFVNENKLILVKKLTSNQKLKMFTMKIKLNFVNESEKKFFK